MENGNLKRFGYDITDDPSFMRKRDSMTLELEEQLPGLHSIAIKGKQSGIKKINRLIKKFPRNPQLKNILSMLYYSNGNYEKAKVINHWIITEHPNYLYAKINLALEFFQKNDFSEMTNILGEEFNLKTLYPERELFHLTEVTAINKVAVFYYSSIGNFEEAYYRLEIIKTLDPESSEYYQAKNQLLSAEHIYQMLK